MDIGENHPPLLPKGKGRRQPCCSHLLQVLGAEGEWQQLLQPLDDIGAVRFGQVDVPVRAELEEKRGEKCLMQNFFLKLLK